MKFNCDRFSLSKELRKQRRAKYLTEWHPIFVLYKRIGPEDCRVLETVYRKYEKTSRWSYRQKKDIVDYKWWETPNYISKEEYAKMTKYHQLEDRL